MTFSRVFRYYSMLFCLLAVFSVPAFGFIPRQQEITKKRLLADLDAIHNVFEVKYAPKPWKREFADWDLDQAIEDAKNKVKSHPSLTLKEGQVILRDFFNSTQDYHVGIRFYSTESASLPFMVKSADQRYFVTFVDREVISKHEFPFEEGDEILMFDGRPVHEVVQEIRSQEFGNNTFETDQALAELVLTQRRGELGHHVPKGYVEIVGYKKGTYRPVQASPRWHYIPEKIKDFAKLGTIVDTPEIYLDFHQDFHSLLKQSHFFDKMMVFSQWNKSYVGAFTQFNKHTIGARTSFIPELGRVVWESGSASIFRAYMFSTPSGKRIGYVRIPHYTGDEEEVKEFGELMNFFQSRTEALVIDQVNNPGGSVFYLYALASTLTDKPLYTPKHHIALSQEEVFIANQMLPQLEQVSKLEDAHELLGDTVGGYPVDLSFTQLMIEFCRFIIAQWDNNQMFTDPTFLFGVDKIQPHPKYRFTKPILLLTNSLDFSGGDFFPAILQDNQRATILGTRTAGAGGYVVGTSYPNHSGILSFMLTGSLAERIDQKPIENLGITPDLPYDLSVVDLQENYREYVDQIVRAVELLVESR